MDGDKRRRVGIIPQRCPEDTQSITKNSEERNKSYPMTENEISNIIIGCSIDVHKVFGPGLLESAYRECLFFDLTEKGPYVIKEKPMPIVYKGVRLDHGYGMGLLVENKVVVELKE